MSLRAIVQQAARSSLSLPSRQAIIPAVVFSPFMLHQQRFAGHNKWSKVKHIKGAKDAKKSKLYSKISLELISAVRAGNSSDPTVNTKLATVLNRAKASNMPKDNIENAIKKALDKNKDALDDVVYECYGPSGIAMIIEAVTDKKSRTVKEVKEVLNRVGGSVSSVGWMFDKKGRIVFASGESNQSLEQMMDAAIEVGAEDIEEMDGLVEIICDFSQLNAISCALSDQKFEVQCMEATYVPQSTVEITDAETAEIVEKCLDDMENLDDVVKVHSNAVINSVGDA